MTRRRGMTPAQRERVCEALREALPHAVVVNGEGHDWICIREPKPPVVGRRQIECDRGIVSVLRRRPYTWGLAESFDVLWTTEHTPCAVSALAEALTQYAREWLDGVTP